MLWFISLILTIMYIIWLTRLINFGVNTATRIAYATERNADNTALLIQALSPEAKGRIADVLEERQRVVETARQDLHRREKGKDTTIRALAIAGLVGLAIYLVLSFAAHAGEQQVIRDASGRTIGTATTNSQGTTVFRDAGGRTTGTASTTPGGFTTFRDSSGRTTGTTTIPSPRR
jgi:hypothetical protein